MEERTSRLAGLERRRKPRIPCQYMAVIHGRDVNGNKYDESARLTNLSASGLFMLVKRSFHCGETVFVVVRLYSDPIVTTPPSIATNGVVMRTEPQKDGNYGVAMKFQHYRFL